MTCQCCGKKLPPRRRVWCSTPCAREGQGDRISAATQAARRATVLQCEDCSAAFQSGGTKGFFPRRCAPCRRQRRAAQNAESLRRSRARRAKP